MENITCKNFIGKWSIVRRITDYQFNQERIFLGEAEICREDQRFVYRERGNLKLNNNKSIFATQSYIWIPKSSAVFKILFKDGRYFHTLNLRKASDKSQYATVHLCKPDLYQVQYNFAQFPDWRSNWRVTGPKKNYQINSFFQQI